MYGYIYMFTNRINGKKYIGQRKGDKIDQNYFGSGIYFANAKEKYGIENFKFDILCWCKTLEEANKKEKYYIEYYNTLVRNNKGYNIQLGGNVGNSYAGKTDEEMEEIRKKQSIKQKEIWSNKLYKKLMKEKREKQNPWINIEDFKREEWINNIKESQLKLWKTDRKEDRKTIGERLSKANKNIPKSKDHRQKNSRALTNNPKKCKKILCIETNIVYPSLREAERQTGISRRSISGNCNKESRYSYAGKDKNGNKLHWEWLNG